MKNTACLFAMCIAFNVHIFAQDDVDSLLLSLAQQGDLSEQTKQESVGHLRVFTRLDLELMKINTFKDLLDFLPFTRYNEDNRGFTNLTYSPYQPSRTDTLRLYINDREVVTPYYGSAMQVFGQMSLKHIDHVEYYYGASVFENSIEFSAGTIKLYTKDPTREETNLLGSSFGTYGSKNIYAYSAQSFDDFSYLLHVNKQEMNRSTLHKDSYELSRDLSDIDIFGQINTTNHTFEFQGLKGEADTFLGNSWGMMPEKNEADFDYLYGGWYFDNQDGLKASFNIARARAHVEEQVADGMAILSFSPLIIITEQDIKSDEKISDAHLSKKWSDATSSLVLGLRGRYKTFDFYDMSINGTEQSFTGKLDTEFISSAYVEASHLFDDRNMIVASSKIAHYNRNGGIEDDTHYTGRIGYIHNMHDWKFKFFSAYIEFAPELMYLSYNEIYAPTEKLIKEKSTNISAEMIYTQDRWSFSLLLGRAFIKNNFYYDVDTFRYKNLQDDILLDNILVQSSYQFDPSNSIEVSTWILNTTTKEEPSNTTETGLGGYVKVLNTLGKFDISNVVHFYGLDYADANGPGYNYNASVTYNYSRQLMFYLKGTNLLGKALTTDYYTYNPLTATTTVLKDVDVFDRTVWFGLEYQF
jgi:hypothetical protein